tara:strand:+ start:414 stop:938 length:525 start_codon:yes stop_codon:yes gene_type:complete
MNKFKFSNYKLPHMPDSALKQTVSSSGGTEYPVSELKESMKRRAVENTEDPELANFFGRIHTLDNPEYASYTKKLNPGSDVFGKYDVTGTMASESEPARSLEYDYFIKNRNKKSDETAKQMIDLNKQAQEFRKNREFAQARDIYKQQNVLRNMMKQSVENYSPSADLEERMKNK